MRHLYHGFNVRAIQREIDPSTSTHCPKNPRATWLALESEASGLRRVQTSFQKPDARIILNAELLRSPLSFLQ
jgi:hypothetical protein